MTSNDHDTDNAPTSAGSGATDETTVVPTPPAAALELAWSLGDDDDTEPAERQSWGLAWGHAAVVLSIAAVVAFVIAIVGWTIMRSGHDSQPLPAEAKATTQTMAPAESPWPAPPVASPPTSVGGPATKTWAPKPTPPPTLAADPGPDANDQDFLQALRSAQININDQLRALFGARWVCGEFRDGYSRADVIEAVKGRNDGLTDLGAVDFVADSVKFYCPQYAGMRNAVA